MDPDINMLHRVPGIMRPGLDIGGGRWWIFSWLQIWPDGDSFVWASKKGGGSKYTLKCWLWEFLKVAAVNTLSTPRDETKRNVSHSFLSMMNVTGQWPSSWLFIWSRAETRMTVLMMLTSRMKHFPKHYHHHHLPEDKGTRHDSPDSFLIR